MYWFIIGIELLPPKARMHQTLSLVAYKRLECGYYMFLEPEIVGNIRKAPMGGSIS